MPGPGAGDDSFYVLKLRPPAEFGADFFRAGDEAWRVSGAARFFNDGDFIAGDFFTGGDDFADAGAAAGAEVVACARWSVEGEHVRLCEVEDVDVVADAGAVG